MFWYILKCKIGKAEFLAALLQSSFNMQIWCSKNIINVEKKKIVLLSIFVETMIFFSGFFDK